jgi:hypothetical protein
VADSPITQQDPYSQALARVRTKSSPAVNKPEDKPEISLYGLHPKSVLAGVGPESIKRIAMQSRRLTPKESDAIRKKFGKSVDPNDIRIAYDSGVSGTNLRGYVMSRRLPTVEFYPPDERAEVPESLLHETTHVWQNLIKGKYTNPDRPGYEYDQANAESTPFTELGSDQQAEMIQNNVGSAERFVQGHPAGSGPLGDMAFLDSVRQRYEKSGLDADTAARLASGQPGAHSVAEWSHGQPKFKQMAETELLKPKLDNDPYSQGLQRVRQQKPAAQAGPSLSAPPPPLGVQPLEAGNVDLYNRPKVHNPKTGGTSTVFSKSWNIDGKEVLLPTVSDDGRMMSDDEAKAQYRKTGKHLGKFKNPADANAYAKQLHEDYAAGKYEKRPTMTAPPTMGPVDPWHAKIQELRKPGAQLPPVPASEKTPPPMGPLAFMEWANETWRNSAEWAAKKLFPSPEDAAWNVQQQLVKQSTDPLLGPDEQKKYRQQAKDMESLITKRGLGYPEADTDRKLRIAGHGALMTMADWYSPIMQSMRILHPIGEAVAPLEGASGKLARRAFYTANAALGGMFAWDSVKGAWQNFSEGNWLQGWSDLGGAAGIAFQTAVGMYYGRPSMSPVEVRDATIDKMEKLKQTLQDHPAFQKTQELKGQGLTNPILPNVTPDMVQDVINQLRGIREQRRSRFMEQLPTGVDKGRAYHDAAVLPDNDSMYMSPEERSQSYYTLEEARRRLDEENERADVERAAQLHDESESARILRERREDIEGKARYRAERAGEIPVIKERRGLRFDTEGAEANFQEHERLGGELERIANEHMYTDANEMMLSLEQEKARGRKLEDWKRNVLDLGAKRRELLRLTDPSLLEPVETGIKGYAADSRKANREQDMRDASAKIEAEAKTVTDPDRFADLQSEAEEAKRRAEDLRTERDKEEARRAAAQDGERAVYPLGPPINSKPGRGADIILPDGRKVPYHYAVVSVDDLISSHDPLKNFAPNENAIQITQGRDYVNNKESQAATIARGQNPEWALLFNTAPTAETGPPIVRADGQGLGGRNRINIMKLAYRNGHGEAARDYILQHAGEFGIQPSDIPEVGKQPVIVRVLDNEYTTAEDLAALGRDLDRTQTMGFSQAEEAVVAGRAITPEFLDWISNQVEAMGEDATLRDFMRYRASEIMQRMLETGMIEPTKRAEYITNDGQMTEKAKDLFENAVLGKIVEDPELLATLPKEIRNKVGRLAAPLVRVKDEAPLWNFIPELKMALKLWKRIDNVRAMLNDIGGEDDSLVDRYLRPANYENGSELIDFGGETVRETPHPTVEALAKLLEKPSKEAKNAIAFYADDSEGKQATLGPPPEPVEAFNTHIGSKVGVDVPADAWGVLKPPQKAAGEAEAPVEAPEVTESPKTPPESPQAKAEGAGAQELREFMRKHQGIGPLADPLMDAMTIVVENVRGEPIDEFLKPRLAKITGEESEFGPMSLRQDVDALRSWMKRSGRGITVEPYGEQLSMFGAPEKAYMLRNRKGQEAMVLQSQLDALMKEFPELRAREAQGGLFGAGTETFFGPPPDVEEPEQGGLFGPPPGNTSLPEDKFELKPPPDEPKDTLFQEADQPLFQDEQLSLPRFPVRRTLPTNVDAVFASGSNRTSDIRGFVEAGVPVGVDVNELSSASIHELEELAGKKIPVFVDSGAFGEVKWNAEKGKLEPVKPITDAEWNRRLDIYDRLADKLGKQLTVVAPDRVGDQAETLARLAKYSDRIKALRAKGVRVVVAVQRGDVPMADFFEQAKRSAGVDDLIPAMPMKKAAATPEMVVEFAGKVKPKEIHLLGMGATAREFEGLARSIAQVSPETKITSDANRLRAMAGTDSKMARRREELKGEELTTPFGATAFGPYGRSADYTDAIASPGSWATKVQLKDIAEKAGLKGAEAKRFVAEPDKFLQESEEGTSRWEDPRLSSALDEAWMEYLKKAQGSAARAQAITETVDRSKIGGQGLFQPKKGATKFLEDGRAVLGLFQNADASTFLHEFFHLMRRYLPEADTKVLENWLKIKDGIWSRKHEETAARAWEYYHRQREVKSLPEKVRGIFGKIQAAMKDIYAGLRGSPLVKPSAEVTALFDRWYGAGKEVAKEMSPPPEPTPEAPKPKARERTPEIQAFIDEWLPKGADREKIKQVGEQLGVPVNLANYQSLPDESLRRMIEIRLHDMYDSMDTEEPEPPASTKGPVPDQQKAELAPPPGIGVSPEMVKDAEAKFRKKVEEHRAGKENKPKGRAQNKNYEPWQSSRAAIMATVSPEAFKKIEDQVSDNESWEAAFWAFLDMAKKQKNKDDLIFKAKVGSVGAAFGLDDAGIRDLVKGVNRQEFAREAAKNPSVTNLEGKPQGIDDLIVNPPMRVNFEHAVVYGTINDAAVISKGKTQWGKFVGVEPLGPEDEVHPQRITYGFKETNKMRQRWEIRDNFKNMLKDRRSLVANAMQMNKGEFLGKLKPEDTKAIQQATAMDPAEFWQVVRNGEKLGVGGINKVVENVERQDKGEFFDFNQLVQIQPAPETKDLAPPPGDETKEAISAMHEAMAEDHGDANLVGWAPGKDREAKAAIDYASKQLTDAGWKYNAKQKQFEKDGWYAFLRSQGDLSSPILQWNKLEAQEEPKPKPKKEKIAPIADAETKLSPEDRKDMTLQAQAGVLPLDTGKVREKTFPDYARAEEWAKANKNKIKGLQLFKMTDGRWVADFTAKNEKTLFQTEEDPAYQIGNLNLKIAKLQARLQGVMSDAERAMINTQIRDLRAKRDALTVKAKPAPTLEPPPAKTITLWTPEGEREVPRGERADEPRAATDVPPPISEPRPTPRVSERPESPRVPGSERGSGRGVRTAGEGEGGGGTKREPKRALPDVKPVALRDAPMRGPAAYPATDWAEKVKNFRLPANAPAPTRQISPEIADLLMPGQKEVVESVVSGLDQHNGYILATTTGTGKTYMGSAVISDLLERKPDAKILILTPSQGLIRGRDGWMDVGGNFGLDIQDMPTAGMPDDPGVYISTWMGSLNREGIEYHPWDLVIADETQEARRWWASQRGDKMKTMAEHAHQVVYTSATPFHTALEIGHMGKLGLWSKQEGFESWAVKNQLGVYRDKAGNLAGGNAPMRLEKLRQQLIERGQMINIDRDMNGYSAHFGKVPMDAKTEQGLDRISSALQMAENFFRMNGRNAMVRAVRAQTTTLAKRWLESSRLPQAIELGKKLEKQGWKVIFFSENKKEFTELFDFLKPADAAMGGRISQMMPKFPSVTDTLQEAFGDDVAIFAGPHSAARESEKDAFIDDEKKHIYATYGAGGVGVSLHDKIGTKPRAVIYLGPPWSGIAFDQALGRPWRYGTKSDVRAYFLFSDAQAEMDLVTNKVAPRMESLRAMVSGVNFADPVVKHLREVPENREAAIDYDHGNEHKADFEDFKKKADRSGVMPYSELPVVDAKTAHNKGMKIPGAEGVQGPRVAKLWQEAEDEVLPAELEAPELSTAREVNIDLADRFIKTGAAPGGPGGKNLTAPQRQQVADAVMARADLAASKDPASAVQQVYTEWENAIKQIDAIMSAGGQPYELYGADGAGGGMTSPPGMADLPSGEGKPPQPEKIGSAKAVEWYMLTNGRDVIRAAAKKSGQPEIGDKIARSIAQYHVESGNISGQWTTKYWDILSDNKIKGKEHDVLALTLMNREKHRTWIDNELARLRSEVPMNARIEKAANEAQALFKDVFKRMQKENVYLKVWDARTGQSRQVYYNEFGAGEGYWPMKYDYDKEIRIPDKDGDIVFTLRDLAKDPGSAKKERIIRGMMERHGLSRTEVQDFLSAKSRNVPLAGHLERAREADMPFARTDPDVVISYLEGAGEILARKRYFGQEGEKAKGMLAQIQDEKARKISSRIVDSLLQRQPMEDESRWLLRAAADWSVISKMTFSSIKALGHATHGALMTNTRSFLKGVFEGITDHRQAARMADLAGATQEQTKIEMLSEFGVNKQGFASKYLRAVGWQGAYKMGRVIAAANARIYLTDYAMSDLMKDPQNQRVRRQVREFMMLDDNKIDAAIARHRWSEEDLRWASKAFSDKVMFTYDPTELPPAWRARSPQDPAADFGLMILRLTTLLKGYQFKTHALLKDAIWDEARKGNFRPLVPFVTLYPLIGQLIWSLTAMATINKKHFQQLMDDKNWTPGQTFKRGIEDIAHMIGDSQLTAALDAMQHGKVALGKTIAQEYLTGPAIGDLMRTIGVPFDYAHARTSRGKANVLRRYVEETAPITRPVESVLSPPPDGRNLGMAPLPRTVQ